MTPTSRLAGAAVALALLTGLAACAKDASAPDPSAPPASPVAATTAAAPGTTAPARSEPVPAAGGAATPEESLQLLLRAVAADDAEGACRQMAFEQDGRKGAVALDPAQMAGCSATVTRAAQQAPADKRTALGMVTVTSASVRGDTATVTGKDMAVGPATLETFVPAPITLSRLRGRWYVDVAAVWQLVGAAGATAGPTR